MNKLNLRLLGPVGLVIAFGLWGCGSGKHAELINVVSLAKGDAHCPAGGTEIQTGIDNGAGGGKADDGVLQSGEVTNTQYVCNQVAMLTREEVLGQGDAHCPSGGTELDQGLDNGANGGIAGDGILENGEVTSTQYICNSDGLRVGSFVPPPGNPGPYRINASGGTGDGGSGGGNGGYFQAYMNLGTLGGHVKLFATGQVDAGFTIPSAPTTVDVGPVPLNVSGSTTVPWVSWTGDAGLANGAFYTTGTTQLPIYRWFADGGSSAVTGVNIAAGATLTLAASTSNSVSVSVAGPVQNAGTLTTSAQPGSGTAASLSLSVASYFGLSGSRINLSGAAGSSSADGGGGGALLLEANQTGPLGAPYGGSVINEGTITTSGGNGASGGMAGPATLNGLVNVINTGSISAQGGSALLATGAGGWGAPIRLNTQAGQVLSSGTLDSSGGSGGWEGGSAGKINLTSTNGGAVRNSATLRAVGGGVGAACTGLCFGGAGAGLELYTYGNDLVNSGDCLAFGANGAGSGNGGPGGYFYAYAGGNCTAFSCNNTELVGNIRISGNLDVHGGSGGGGGQGGYVFAEIDPAANYGANGQEIQFLGYGAGLNLRGGSGSTYGGSGGYVLMYNNYSYLSTGQAYPGGSVLNTVNIDASGGAGSTTNSGGPAGYVQMYTQATYAFPQNVEMVVNSGNLTMNGGAGGSGGGGQSGYDYVYGRTGVTNNGTVQAIAGLTTSAATGTPTNSNNNTIWLWAEQGPTVNTGALTAKGGDNTTVGSTGGASYGIWLNGTQVTNNAALTATGGGGALYGGRGGPITLISTNGSSSNSGALNASGGTGSSPANAGAKGQVSIDGIVQ